MRRSQLTDLITLCEKPNKRSVFTQRSNQSLSSLSKEKAENFIGNIAILAYAELHILVFGVSFVFIREENW